jgi:hypothetical protein
MKKVHTEKSFKSSTKVCNCHPPSTGEYVENKNKECSEAIDRYKKICVKISANPHQGFISTLKGENLNIYLDNYNVRDIHVINKVIGGFFYFKQIFLSPFDARGNTYIKYITSIINNSFHYELNLIKPIFINCLLQFFNFK